jgi:F-type H+-transporting ATPase subunit b
MDQREAELRERVLATERNRAAAEREAQELAAARRSLEEHRQAEREEAEREVERWREEQMRHARREIERAEERWRESLAREQAELLADIQERVGGLVTTVLRLVLPGFADATIERRSLEIFLGQLEQLDQSRRDELVDALAAGAPAIVQSAAELPDDARRRIEEALARQLHRARAVHFEVAPALICGLTLRVDGYTLGWNLRDILQQLDDEFRLGLREGQLGPTETRP